MDNVTIPNPKFQIKAPEPFNSSMRRRREEEIDRMYESLNKHETDNYMLASEFAQFEELYSLENRQRILQQSMSDQELERLMVLSLQLSQKINMYKPLHVVDEQGNEVMPPLPPMLSRLQSLHGAGNDAINIFHNAFSRDENTPMGQIQQRRAAENLSRLIAMSQNQEAVLTNMANFDEMAQKFHKDYLGKPVFPERPDEHPTDIQVNGLPPDPSDKPIAVKNSQPNSTDFFDFEDETDD